MPDAYTRRARLAPATLAAAAPIVLFAGSLLALEKSGVVVGFLLAAVSLVIAGLVRGRGRAIEPQLWASWGGAPTTTFLRWSGPTDRDAQSRRHTLLEGILGQGLPSAVEEEADPDGADRRYATATAALRDLTRDQDRFSLVAEENREYGFRRNSLGLRPLALVVSTLTALLSAILAIAAERPACWLSMGISLLVLGFWFAVVRADWVRAAAELYAQRLLEAAESLSREHK